MFNTKTIENSRIFNCRLIATWAPSVALFYSSQASVLSDLARESVLVHKVTKKRFSILTWGNCLTCCPDLNAITM